MNRNAPRKEVSRELRILARAGLRGDPGEAWPTSLVDGPLDWELLAALARRHGMVPLLYQAIQDGHLGEPPRTVLEGLAAERRVCRARTGQQMADLERLLEAFDARGVPVLSLKGFLLSARLYGGLSLRESKDLDLLVPRAQRRTACRVLQDQGYRPIGFDPDSNAQEWFLERYGLSMDFLHPVRGTNVEVHWFLHQRPDWEDPSAFPVPGNDGGEGPDRQLPPREETLDLLAHGGRHGWYRLKWLTDLWRAWETYEVDWEAWSEKAVRLGFGPALVSAHLLRRWILPDVPLPSGLEVPRTARKRGVMLARWAYGDLTSPPSSPPRPKRSPVHVLSSVLLELATAPGPWRRRRLRAGLVTTEDVAAWELPSRLYPLYPLLKPVWWVARRAQRLRRNSQERIGRTERTRTAQTTPPPDALGADADSGDGHYRMFGLTVESDVGLPFEAANGEDHREANPDLTIRLGEGLAAKENGDGHLITVAGAGRILVRDPSFVLVEPAEGATPDDLLLHLLGSTTGLIAWKRGWIPLHATAVRFGDRCILIAGHRGMGKSTLAAACLAQGAELVSDDLTPIQVGEDGRVVVPGSGPRRVKLWPDAAERFAPGEVAGQVQEGVRKFDVRAAPARDEPVRVEALLQLTEEMAWNGQEARLLQGADALAAVTENLYRASLMPEEVRARVLPQVAALAGSIEIMSVRRPEGLDAVEELAERLASGEWTREA